MIRPAKSGDPILLIRGCATASTVDPIGEGQRWVRSQEPTIRAWVGQVSSVSNLQSKRSIIVVGLGSGYHIQALHEFVAIDPTIEITVIESDHDLIAMKDWFTQRLVPSIRLAFIEKVDQNTLYENEAVKNAIASDFLLLKHKPSFIRNGRDMEIVASWLTGRDRISLENQLRLQTESGLFGRRAIRDGLDMTRLPATLISIKDLSRAWKIDFEPSSERRVFRILEELVR